MLVVVVVASRMPLAHRLRCGLAGARCRLRAWVGMLQGLKALGQCLGCANDTDRQTINTESGRRVQVGGATRGRASWAGPGRGSLFGWHNAA